MSEERKLIQQMYDALEYTRSHHKLHSNKVCEALNAADAYLASPDWIRVEDALPVVPPLYAEVAIWMVDSRFPNPIRKTFRVTDKALHQYITHWQYDIQPKPPKG